MARKAPEKKLIDILHKALKGAGYRVSRDGWEDYIIMENEKGEKEHLKDDQGHPIKDHCEWLDIIGPWEEDAHQTTLHFYFENNATELTAVNVYREDWRRTSPVKKTAGMFKLKKDV